MSKITISNVPNSSKDRMNGNVPWIDGYVECRKTEKKKELPDACPACGKRTSDFDGCHVYVKGGDSEVFIVPMCHQCNTTDSEKEISASWLETRDDVLRQCMICASCDWSYEKQL